ncbi:MAG: AI-2E family transporter [Clostridium sp.]|uniref:AI-2E family transporter n=1 Tax=Clostridium sp. TaxID=1506 RepID=UPI003F338B95
MGFNKYLKYKDILILVVLAFIGYKIVDNYNVYFSLIKKFIVVMTPFIYAFIFAYILNPVMKLFEKKFHFNRGGAVAGTYVIVAGILVLIGIFVVPSIIDSIISITKEIPSYVDTVQGWFNAALKHDKVYTIMQDSGVLSTLSMVSSKIGTILMSVLENTAGSLLTITTDIIMFFFGFLISIYILIDKERFIKQAKIITVMILGEKRSKGLIGLCRTYNKMIGAYIGSKALDSLIIGLMSLVGLMILKVPYAILLAIVVGFTNMIPYFGPFVGEVVCSIVALFVSPWKALSVFIFLLALQQFDAWYLEPKIVGGKVGVSPFLIVLGVTVGGGFFGPVGMLLASPTVATLKVYYDRKASKFEEKEEDVIDNL